MRPQAILPLTLSFLSFSLYAQDQPPKVVEDPYAQDDGSWIGINGTVASVGAGDFVLNYGDGTITVELADDTTTVHQFMEHERVTVIGVVDENFFRSTTIQARAVFVESLSTYVHVMDGSADRLKSITPALVSVTMVQGRVTGVTGKHLTVDKGNRMITVDLSRLQTDPNEADHMDRIKEGDHITVTGDIDRTFWKGHVIRATNIEVTPVREY